MPDGAGKTIRKQQKEVQTPEQAVKELPEVLPLPKPITVEEMEPPRQSHQTRSTARPVRQCPSWSQANLKDEKAKTEALSRERDDALRAARGGSLFGRVARAAKWFVIGATAGAVAARLAH